MTVTAPSLALLHHHFGPYHMARARVLRETYPGAVHLLQLANSESARVWRIDESDLSIETAVPGVLDQLPPGEVEAGVDRMLDRVDPQVLAIAGYADRGMRRAAAWARRRGRMAILLSDSQTRDVPRRSWKEWVKRRWVTRHYARAFVAGASAASYVESLGIPGHHIWRGYDVVDNAHFATGADRARQDAARLREELGLPARFLLYVGRFAPEKNLSRLLAAFRRASEGGALAGRSLVLVGGGPLEATLRAEAAPLGDRVHFAGFQQLERLPAYYGLADGLLLPSLSEPWGLVVNEAMAAGLPVLVSSQCGCAMELVFPGLNGVIVDPEDVGRLASTLAHLAGLDDEVRRAYGEASRRIIQNYSLEAWARALGSCAAFPVAG